MFDRIKSFLDHWHEVREAENLSDRDLADIGLSRDQLRHFLEMPEDVEDRVTRMAAVFGLTPDEIRANHAGWVELLEVCGGCTERRACGRVLDQGDAARAEDCNFCRNRASFLAMASATP